MAIVLCRFFHAAEVAPITSAQLDITLFIIGFKACSKSTLIKVAIIPPMPKSFLPSPLAPTGLPKLCEITSQP
ncbi:hypothetical protein FRC10_006589 [Ceratobasidium sp. 414]|nr:hypothetical protein FRC10_006589 [Ceratobasidium sp. 414]